MNYLFDTTICVDLIRHRPTELLNRLAACSPGDVGVSTITIAELYHGTERSARSEANRIALEQFLLPLVIIDFDERAADQYGRLRAHLERQGTPIGSMDMLIAAHALALGATVVTNNLREFPRVPDLKVENWNTA